MGLHLQGTRRWLWRELGGGTAIDEEAVQLGGAGWVSHSRPTACSSHVQLPAWGGERPALARLLLCLTTGIAGAHLLPTVSHFSCPSSSSSYSYPENESGHSLLLLVAKRRKSKFLNWGGWGARRRPLTPSSVVSLQPHFPPPRGTAPRQHPLPRSPHGLPLPQ